MHLYDNHIPNQNLLPTNGRLLFCSACVLLADSCLLAPAWKPFFRIANNVVESRGARGLQDADSIWLVLSLVSCNLQDSSCTTLDLVTRRERNKVGLLRCRAGDSPYPIPGTNSLFWYFLFNFVGQDSREVLHVITRARGCGSVAHFLLSRHKILPSILFPWSAPFWVLFCRKLHSAMQTFNRCSLLKGNGFFKSTNSRKLVEHSKLKKPSPFLWWDTCTRVLVYTLIHTPS